MPTPSPRADAVRACLAALAAASGPPSEQVKITIESNGSSIVYTVSPAEAAAVLGPPAGAGLSPLERSVLSAAGPAPLPAKRLAAKLGRPCNSHFRDALRSLVRRGLLAHGPDGYGLPPVK